MLSATPVHEPLPCILASCLWYFAKMQPRTQPARRPLDRSPSTASAPHVGAPLSTIHADALYRPVPPVEYDDEGYPGPDGRMPESMLHAEATNYAFDALRVWFRDRPDTLVANDLLMLFEEGNPAAALAPDAMVVFGAGGSNRTSYKVWREGHAVPAFALEVLSASTWRKDVRVKPGLYAALGVRELVLFEPFGPELAGFALEGTVYAPVRTLPDGGLPSRVLGLDVVVEDGRLRFRNPETGEILPEHLRLAALHSRSEAMRVEAEAMRVETETMRMKAEGGREQEAAARRHAEARAATAERRTETERARADLAERRIAELEGLLKRSPR